MAVQVVLLCQCRDASDKPGAAVNQLKNRTQERNEFWKSSVALLSSIETLTYLFLLLLCRFR